MTANHPGGLDLHKIIPKDSTLRVHFPDQSRNVKIWVFRHRAPEWDEQQ